MGTVALASRYEVFETRVPSVDRAFDLLENLANAKGALTLSDIARRLDIPKSSAHYLLQSLVRRGYVHRDLYGRRYTLGVRMGVFARASLAKSQMKLVCAPYLRQVVHSLSLPAQIGILDGSEGMILARIDTGSGTNLDSWSGRHFDLHCTALGKALIFSFSEREIENLFRYRGLPRHNQNTICSLQALKIALEQARQNGYAIDNEEQELGIRCVAAPIYNSFGTPLAALCVCSSENKTSTWQPRQLGGELIKVTTDISRAISDSP